MFLAAIAASVLFLSCKKESVPSNEVSLSTVFYRLKNQSYDSISSISSVVVVRGVSLLSESNPTSSPNENGHYDGDGCDEGKPEFCSKHPWHKKCNTGTLPLTLVYFTAARENNHVVILWKTSLEDNIARFIVERSLDGATFKPIAYVTPKGVNLEYKVLDYGK